MNSQLKSHRQGQYLTSVKIITTLNRLAFGLRSTLGSRAAVTNTVYTNIKSKKESFTFEKASFNTHISNPLPLIHLMSFDFFHAWISVFFLLLPLWHSAGFRVEVTGRILQNGCHFLMLSSVLYWCITTILRNKCTLQYHNFLTLFTRNPVCSMVPRLHIYSLAARRIGKLNSLRFGGGLEFSKENLPNRVFKRC